MHKSIRALRLCLALASALLTSIALTAHAQEVSARPPGERIPAEAKKAVLVVADNGDMTLDGKAARLSAAAQIRGTNNLLVLSQSLRGKYAVRVLLDNAGQIHRAWIMDGS